MRAQCTFSPRPHFSSRLYSPCRDGALRAERRDEAEAGIVFRFSQQHPSAKQRLCLCILCTVCGLATPPTLRYKEQNHHVLYSHAACAPHASPNKHPLRELQHEARVVHRRQRLKRRVERAEE